MSVPADGAASAASISATKSALRKTLLAVRRAAGTDPDADTRLCSALMLVPELRAAAVVAGYVALPGEPDITGALRTLVAAGTQVVLPVLLESGDLELRQFAADKPLVPGPLGTRVPAADSPRIDLAAADVVLVPAVAADRQGHRLGRGGGSYDRALRRVRPDALVVAVVRERELLNAVPVEPHDYPVNGVLAGARFLRASGT